MKKLDHKRHSPFEVIEKVSTHAYRLQLPSDLKGIHNIFHVSLLEEVAPEHHPQRQLVPLPLIEIDGIDEYEVATILDSHHRKRRVEYLVCWVGYGPEDDTWLMVDQLQGSRELLDEFHGRYPRKPHARY